ncbi:leucine-rich repeat-containing protein 63 [Varanus komodoensis]|uniref:leucine-rich repeat-containing protein 63 n=1 Tax=Varanus komodoensis TaxID=61221 RepID=UPI001CF7AF2A|nr:leucine-rich repeat-containing protein 63 [Varanus komodoensis]
MFELKLLRRPLPPKVETELLLPRRKHHKGDVTHEDKSKEILGADKVQLSTSEKSQQIYLCFPDYDSGIQVPAPLKRNFIIPLQPSGPPSFPMQKRRTPIRLRIPVMGRHPLHLQSDFTLQGLAMVASLHHGSLKSAIVKPMVSRCNYEVLTSQLAAEERRGPKEVSTILLSLDEYLSDVELRKPERQRLIGIPEDPAAAPSFRKGVTTLTASLKVTKQHLGAAVRGIKIQKMLEEGILPEDSKKKKKKRVTYAEPEMEMGFSATLVSGIGYKPQLSEEEMESDLKTKAERAALFCLACKRTGLSLKAYFLNQLPDLSPLAEFLVYLNLSFNSLYFFPTEVFQLKHLEVLKLRNNPIKFIPDEINQMKSLKYLVMSFNLLTSLPSGLFTLPNLQGLDVSYNEIESLSSDIGNLRSLTYLSLEGNLLYVLPCGLLKLQLSCLKVENNFLHAYFWSEICQLQPQRLTDMAALCFAKHKLWDKYHEISKAIQGLLQNVTVCDCCLGPLYGNGLRFLRIYKNIYGLRLPYLFHACSPTCYMDYVSLAASD